VTNFGHAAARPALIPVVDSQAIVAGLARGDTRAFDAAYDLHRAPLYVFLVRLAGAAALAEDLLQETWLRLARHSRALPPGTELRPWLFTVARNLYRSHRRWALLDAGRLRELGWLPAPDLAGPFEATAAGEARRELEAALALLPVEHREVLLLCTVSGFEPSEAAGILGISAEATRQRLARARARLRERLRMREVMP
jgi:RNA polymerase sigma-70 factor, ECF subfamily